MKLRKELDRHPQEEARAKAQLAGDTAALAKATEELRAVELKVKKIEMDAETRRTTINRLKTQQFETKKNDEYNALGHEIVRYEKEVDQLETKELEAMEEVDTFKAKQKEAEERLTKSKKVVEEDLAHIAERHANMEEQVKEVSQERDKLVAEVSEDILPLYERLMKTKNGLALARMHEGKCEGCHMKLIPSTVVTVQSGKSLARCEDCGRILYAGD